MSTPDIDAAFGDAPLMLALAQITFSQSPEVIAHITDVKAAISLLGMPIAQKRQQMNFAIKAGTNPPQVTHNDIWWFSSLDHRSAVALAQNSVTLYEANYNRFSDFNSKLRTVVDSIVKTAGDGCFLTLVALRYISGFESDGSPSPYLIRGLHGVPTEPFQTDHFHHKYEYWCATEGGGRLAISAKTVHGDEIVSKEFQAAGIAIDGKFTLPRKVDAIQLDLHETIPRKPPARLSSADVESLYNDMHIRIKTAFLSITTEEAHKKWQMSAG